ncbi:MAG: mandelate racemase/muconate lactonizing enzyme family protein, partial [Alphaproteobacteria bacterium]|nr:mandelate racemase/muconate lactonizing enzyme family protein [Alphaproteobacteria bacterium]
MKITNIETVTLSIPFDHGGPPTGFGGTEWRNLDTLLVRVETEEGHVGWGEAFGFNAIPSTRAALETMIAPLVIGRDASDIAALHAELQKVLHIFGRYGQTIYALSGLDIALWDIAGKAAGMPLHRLLGGAQRLSLEAYASLLRYFEPDLVGERAAAAVAQGYRWVKLHERMEPAVAAARAAIPADAKLMVDTNCPWTLAEAVAKAAAFEPHNVHWLEEPIRPPENFTGLAELRQRTDIGIAAGENL